MCTVSTEAALSAGREQYLKRDGREARDQTLPIFPVDGCGRPNASTGLMFGSGTPESAWSCLRNYGIASRERDTPRPTESRSESLNVGRRIPPWLVGGSG